MKNGVKRMSAGAILALTCAFAGACVDKSAQSAPELVELTCSHDSGKTMAVAYQTRYGYLETLTTQSPKSSPDVPLPEVRAEGKRLYVEEVEGWVCKDDKTGQIFKNQP